MKKNLKVISLIFLIALAIGPTGVVYPQETAKQLFIESMEFREVDIKDILRQLAKQYSLNIVFSESVKGLVTVQLNNVSIEQALDSIITVNGFAYTKKENVFKVTSQEEASREGKQTKLFKLNNADALKMKDTLSKVLSTEGSIEADARSNAIVVTDSLSVINKIEAMIPSLDEITPQVLIEAKLIEISLTNNEKLGIDWTATISAQGSARKITFPFSPKGNEPWINNIAMPANSTSTDFASPYGFPYTVKGDFTLGTLDFTSFKAVLDFLRTRSNTKLIASPRILTVNNQKATINVGTVIPVATYERNETSGNFEITGWEQLNVGINLEVIPQISPDGHVKLKLKPEVSNTIGSIGDGINERPIISTRKAETEVQIRNGQTVVIGGLVKEKEAKTEKKVPLLGDLPFIGKLFQHKELGTEEEPQEKTDLLIFVTAHIIKDTADVAAIPDLFSGSAATSSRTFKLEMRGNQ